MLTVKPVLCEEESVLGEEDFFDEVTVLDYLKFRASYGTLGNDNINPQFSLISTFPSYVFNGTITPGSSLGSIPNDDVSWENQVQMNVGILQKKIFIKIRLMRNTQLIQKLLCKFFWIFSF